MEVVLEMTLPRNAESAPLVRHTLDASLRGLGVGSEIRADIALALGEACANVIQHAASGMEYEVRARMDGARCVVEVIDGGTDAGEGDGSVIETEWEPADAAPLAEHGRGLRLMRAFTEELRIADRVHRTGAIVHFEKSLAG
ncbi:ATP-binding protein [Actinomadura geliboluensis]|jgi:serine/threonine-protein kinase RsbW|uniref:ATP-binding protein n=2 Tax=Thermomonosporaceae TaxID=2012 RepID=A0A5S4GNY5_9ACTN|nr:ATP-binding protein [Actinomadura geliboluensis]QKW39685.1 ATP-binding protein [Actinomadura sp. NAK00032]TMR34613.1 ATP-binding protein [Actinomadura geliboluensis]